MTSSCDLHNTLKFREQAVSGVLYNPAAVFLDFRIHQLAEVRPQAFVRSFLIGPH